MLSRIRSLARVSGMVRYLSPWVARAEAWQLSQYGILRRRQISAESTELVSAAGEAMRVGPPRHYANMALRRNELPTLVACLNVFAPIVKGGVAWDIGGNAGFYSKIMSNIVGDHGRVYAFEPVPATFSSMCRSLNQAGVSNVVPINLALSDHDGVMPISYDPASDTTSSLETTASRPCIDVRVAAGDSLVASGECLPPTVIKMDIEGHELKALAGMMSVLASSTCRAVLCEIHFSVFASCGEYRPDTRIRSILAATGFSRSSFISRSHLLATKK